MIGSLLERERELSPVSTLFRVVQSTGWRLDNFFYISDEVIPHCMMMRNPSLSFKDDVLEEQLY